MKKLWAVILAAALALSLAACAAAPAEETEEPADSTTETPAEVTPETPAEETPETEAPAEEAAPAEYALGDTVETDRWRFTLTAFTLGTNLCKDTESDDYLIVDGDYETTFTWGDETYDLAYVAADGRAFAAVGYEMQYLGKETLESMDQLPDVWVDYDDGYIFADPPYTDGTAFVRVDGTFTPVDEQNLWQLEPLSPQAEYRDCLDIPREVLDNTDAPIRLVVSLDGTEYAYRVR